MKRAVVVGAGLAGLSAAVRLADQDFEVIVLERGRASGGRARRLTPGRGHGSIDCGQHLMLGCYRESRSLLDRLQSDHLLQQISGTTPFLSGPDQTHPYRLGSLPAPFDALPALASLTQLGRLERVNLLRAFAAAGIASRRGADRLDEVDALTWLKSHGQSAHAIAGFWEPLSVATLNLPPREASAFLLAKVLDEAFVGGRESAKPLLPSTTLHDLFIAPAISAIERSGGRVLCGCRVERVLEAGPGSIAAVITQSGKRYKADQFLLAVPSWELGTIVSHLPGMATVCRRIAALGSSPILNVDLWFDRPWMRYPYAGLLGSPVQWVFNHQSPGGFSNAVGSHRVSLVISSAREMIGLSREVIISSCLSEIKRYFPESAPADLVDSLVTKVPRATIRGRPGQRALRPGAETAYRNLWLVGDWTRTDLPATIESAVASGHIAARAVAARTGRTLPVCEPRGSDGFLSRLIARQWGR